MFSNMQKFLLNQINVLKSSDSKPEKETDEYKVEKPKITIDTNFKLPITYLEPSELFTLSDIVSNDLELATSISGADTMYDHLFKPKHLFAKQMINQWKGQYTTNKEYLQDTKKVVMDLNNYQKSMLKCEHNVNCDKILTIWEDLKVDNDFLNRYGYIDWDMLAQFNESSVFLQSMTVINVMSPAISLFIPLLFLIFPFIILKIQGIPITFEIYVTVLKDLAKNHFIGKALLTMDAISWDKLVYLIISLGMYLMQIYRMFINVKHSIII